VRILGSLVLLVAATAQAQPFVSDEVVWRTTSLSATYKPAPQAARIEADHDGFLVAWSEVEGGVTHAYAGRLDAAGRLVTIGVRTQGAAGAPSVARFGDRYIAAWVEPEADLRPMLFTGALDRDFNLIAARPIGLTTGPPIVRTTASRAFVGSGVFLYEVDVDGAPVIVYDLPNPIDDLAVAGDQVGYVLHSPTLVPFLLCGINHVCPPGPSPPNPRYDLTFTWLYRLTVQITLPFESSSPATVSSNGSTFLAAWLELKPSAAIKASLFGSTFKPFVVSTRSASSSDRLTQPQLAWDGARWIAVWARGDSIEGAAIAPDLTVTPFTVSARGTRPAIAAARLGRFLVTYEVADWDVRRLASRLIEFKTPNQRDRAVR
jgi:hypothetical protein